MTYDAVNRIVGKTDPGNLVQAYSYNATGNRTLLVDPDGGRYTSSYDSLNRQYVQIDAGNRAFTMLYDAMGRAVTLTFANSAQQIRAYDRNGCETLVNEGAGVLYSMIYDNMLRLNCQLAGANRYTYTYDANNLKRYEDAPTGRTTIIWDGTDYLGAVS